MDGAFRLSALLLGVASNEHAELDYYTSFGGHSYSADGVYVHYGRRVAWVRSVDPCVSGIADLLYYGELGSINFINGLVLIPNRLITQLRLGVLRYWHSMGKPMPFRYAPTQVPMLD